MKKRLVQQGGDAAVDPELAKGIIQYIRSGLGMTPPGGAGKYCWGEGCLEIPA